MAEHLLEKLELSRPQTVTIVGSGGKTTLLFALGRALARSGERVAVSTTTRIHPPNAGQADELWLLRGQAPSPGEAAQRLLPGRLVCLADGLGREGKLHGISWAQSAALAACPGLWLLLEGDGSARKPLKAWAAHEPVVPPQTGLMPVVVGLRGLGRPLSEENVHRARAFAQVSGLDMGQSVTPRALARVLLGPAGPLKALPPGARAVLILNQSDAVQPRLLRGALKSLSLAAAEAPRQSPCYHRIFTAGLDRGRLREDQ